MQHSRAPVTPEVLEGIEAVRLSGRTNMLDVDAVIRIALEMDRLDAAFWIYDHRSLYIQGVFAGFEIGGESACADN